MRLLLSLFMLPFLCHAQVNTSTWGVEDTSICIVKTTDFFNVHDYIAMENHSGSPLAMVWVQHTAPDWPATWEAGFTDPDSVYTNVLVEDTGYFVLPYPVEFSNLLIVNVDHNNYADTSYLKFKVYPAAFPEDSLWLTYCIIINPPGLGFSDAEDFFRVEFIAGQQLLQISQPLNEFYRLQIFDMTGASVMEQSLKEEFAALYLGDLTTGVYSVHLRSAQQTFSKKIVIY